MYFKVLKIFICFLNVITTEEDVRSQQVNKVAGTLKAGDSSNDQPSNVKTRAIDYLIAGNKGLTDLVSAIVTLITSLFTGTGILGPQGLLSVLLYPLSGGGLFGQNGLISQIEYFLLSPNGLLGANGILAKIIKALFANGKFLEKLKASGEDSLLVA